MTTPADIAVSFPVAFSLYSWASECGAGSLDASLSGMLLSILTRKIMALLSLVDLLGLENLGFSGVALVDQRELRVS